jgi:hypothetical protein
MNLKPSILIVISGLVWLAVGVFLMQLGIGFLLEGYTSAAAEESGTPLLSWLSAYAGGFEMAALLLVVVALFIGYLKGRHVLGKAAQRGVDRILALPKPIHISKIYAPRYYLLLGLMVFIGMSMKWFGVTKDWRGFIDVAIGAALINGSIIYFRMARLQKAHD